MIKDGWLERFHEQVRDHCAAEGIEFKTLSLKLGFGSNYIQQLLDKQNVPGADKFVKILNELGVARYTYVLTGGHVPREHAELLKFAAGLSPDQERQVLRAFRSLRDPDAPTE